MLTRLQLLSLVAAGLLGALAPETSAKGKKGFANISSGGFNDPIITVSAYTGVSQGATFSFTEEQANSLYMYNSTAGGFRVANPPPLIPDSITTESQWIRIQFPFKIFTKQGIKSLMKNKGSLPSFLTPNIRIEDNLGTHIPGIPTINGKTAQKQQIAGEPGFPTWLDSGGKNLLKDKRSFVYIATTPGNSDINAVTSAFGYDGDPTTVDPGITDIRVILAKAGGVKINGFWTLKIDDGTGNPRAVTEPTLDAVTPTDPLTPPKTSPEGFPIVFNDSRYLLKFSEPVVPVSVGFAIDEVKKFNSVDPPPLVQQIFTGNLGAIPNPQNLLVPYYPNVTFTASPNGGASNFNVPFNVRPVNPNNLSEYVLVPLLDMPRKVDVTVTAKDINSNSNPAQDPSAPGGVVASAVTTLFNGLLAQLPPASQKTFRTKGGRAFTNVPVSPQALYYNSLSGTGIGVVNLDGFGFETNDAATSRLLLLTNSLQMCACTQFPALPGPYLLGCNPNVFGDPTAAAPVGLGGNPAGTHLGGPTPVPGINEGSVGSTAGLLNPFASFPPGFETVSRNSDGDPRLTKSPTVGPVGDIQVGDFLDALFFDTLNPWAQTNLHVSQVIGNPLTRNSISDPPVPNPPPLRLPVGLPPVDIVFNQQKLSQPAFVIEGDEVFTNAQGIACPPAGDPTHKILLRPNPVNPQAGDLFSVFRQNGPSYQTHTINIGTLTYGARQQIGNFLYVTDRDQGVVQVLNSNNFSVITKIQTPDPEGLGMAPDLKTLYVSNIGDDSLSFIGTDPLSPFFHTELNRVKVGTGPRAVAVQPDNEDVFVCNYLGNSISILSTSSQTIRNTLTDQIKRPWDIALTPRQNFVGWIPAVYFGYIANQGAGNIPIYESGPSGSTGVGADAIRWSVELPSPLAQMRGVVSDLGTYSGSPFTLTGGAYVCHQDSQTGLPRVTRVAFTSQLPAIGAYPPVPLPSTVLNAPGVLQRKFEVVGSWGGPLQTQLNPNGQDQVPYGVAIADFDVNEFFLPQGFVQTNLGALPSAPTLAAGLVNSKHPHRVIQGAIVPIFTQARMYVSFPGDNRIAVIDPNSNNSVLNRIEGAPVAGQLTTFFSQ